MVATTDGFELAERDLELRGEGQLLGARQSGLSDLRFTRLRATASCSSAPATPRRPSPASPARSRTRSTASSPRRSCSGAS